MNNKISNLFEEQRFLINSFFDQLEYDRVSEFVNLIYNTDQQGGIVYLTGMGKSGIMATNIARMLVSIGLRSMSLSSVDALHGDVGVLRQNDILIMMSRSGQTSELINLIPAIRNKKTYLVAIVSNPQGLIAKQADLFIHLPLQKELCPFDLAPTTSSIIQLIFGNTIVSILMRRIGLTREEYAKNHPAGRIGKRLTLLVDDIMKKNEDLPLARPNDIVLDQIDRMSAKLCGCLIITDQNQKLLGMFTDGDLRRAIKTYRNSALQMRLEEVMTVSPWSCTPDQKAYDAMREMERVDVSEKKSRIKEMPVVDQENRVIGLVLLHDLVNCGL